MQFNRNQLRRLALLVDYPVIRLFHLIVPTDREYSIIIWQERVLHSLGLL